MVEDRAGRQSGRRVTVDEAARHLGLTVDAVRKRVQRGQIAYKKDAAGRVRIILDESETIQDAGPDNTGRSTAEAAARQELVEELRDRVSYLEKALDEEREARTEERRRQDTIIAQLSAANDAQARALRSIEGQRDGEPAQESEITTEAPAPPTSLLMLAIFAPIGPAASAILFEASLWGASSLRIWFYVTLVLSLLPAFIGFVVGRNMSARSAAFHALTQAERQEDDGSSPIQEVNRANLLVFAGGWVAVVTGLLSSAGIGLLHSLYKDSVYEGALFSSPTLVIVSLASSVLAALLWVSFAFLGWGLQRQRAQNRAGVQDRTVNWQVIFPLLGSLLSALATVLAAVLGANFAG